MLLCAGKDGLVRRGLVGTRLGCLLSEKMGLLLNIEEDNPHRERKKNVFITYPLCALFNPQKDPKRQTCVSRLPSPFSPPSSVLGFL